ncbi:MAG: hypothetical protein F4139_10125 [Gemmatimonadetes bacterium]|nr:hypothetical protein [Gemmatimonadota bacterium]
MISLCRNDRGARGYGAATVRGGLLAGPGARVDRAPRYSPCLRGFRYGILVGLLAAGQAASAQEARIAMTVDTTLIHVGDPVTVQLSVDHPEGWVVEWPDSFEIAPFEVLHAASAVPAPAATGEGLRSTATLVVTSFELGELELPAIAVPVTAPDGTTRTLVTDPFRIGVESVGLDESGDLRDIKGPLSLARSWWVVLLWVLLAVALAGAAAYYMYRRRRPEPESRPAVPRPPPRPFHEIALEALRALEKSSLLERGQVKEYHVRISEIIRRYIEGQLEVPALELTTREVADGMRRAALGAPITEAFRGFLERCDLVKFAKLRPGADDSRELMGRARELVRTTSGAAP